MTDRCTGWAHRARRERGGHDRGAVDDDLCDREEYATITVDRESAFFDIWLLELDDPVPDLRFLAGVLSDDESTRAARFRADLHRARFIVTRAHMRAILASYLDVRAASLTFAYGPCGKPALAGPFRDLPAFNVSHSDAKAVIAVTSGFPVGVDIERVRQFSELEEVATRYFSQAENDQIARLPPDLRVAAFYRCWTSKEAYLKGRGDGLNVSLADFDVAIDPREPAALLRPYDGDCGWTLHALDIVDDYAVTAAIRDASIVPVVRRWDMSLSGAAFDSA